MCPKNLIRSKCILFIIVTFVTISGCRNKEILDTAWLTLEIEKNGRISGLTDKIKGNDFLAANQSSPLLSIRIDGKFYEPETMSVSDNILTLRFGVEGISAKIRTVVNDSYITLELKELSGPDKVEAVLWGPYKTTIRKTIGETIGVVRDTSFAIGIQALNPRTLGGFPGNEDDSFTGYDIFATTSLVDVADSVHIIYRGSTAKPESYGSSLNAYTRSRKTDRIVSAMQTDQYVAPAFNDEGLVGSRIALFGCHPGKVLDIIEKIELNEGLPHPMLDGIWAKRSKRAVAAYLIQDFSPSDYKEAIEFTEKAGLSYLYHGDPFRTWGHFELRHRMSWDDLANIIKEAESKGIRVGAHTLSNFITTNDKYVTPVPDRRLAKSGSSVLTVDITEDETSIAVADPVFFSQTINNNLHTAMVGKELVRFKQISESQPWRLLECERGAFGTTPASHLRGDTISKLADHAYKVFLTDNDLSKEVSSRIAELFNKTGLKQISFDGLEGNSSTGMGKYGELLFAKNWYDNLSPEIRNDYIMDASTPGHFFWHMFTRMNWGEPWYAGFRESQTEYRLLNQDYFRRNYIPCMLGWFSMRPNTSVEDIEWMLARSAAFDAGYALVTNPIVFKQNGESEQILEKIKEWEKARMTGAFNPDQKKRMENIRNEFTLLKKGDNQWILIQYQVQRFEYSRQADKIVLQGSADSVFYNQFNRQLPGFILTVRDASASEIFIGIDNGDKVFLPCGIKPGESIKYTGGDVVMLYDENWQILKRFPIDPEKLEIGRGKHTIKAGCRFLSSNNGILKLELKTAGDPEQVTGKESIKR